MLTSQGDDFRDERMGRCARQREALPRLVSERRDQASHDDVVSKMGKSVLKKGVGVLLMCSDELCWPLIRLPPRRGE